MASVLDSHDDRAVRSEASGALDVVHVALRKILCCHLLQKIANSPGPFANDVGSDLGRRRHPEAIYIAFTKPLKVKRGLAQGLRWSTAGCRDCSAWPCLLDYRRAVAKERRQFRGALSRRACSNG